MAKRKFFIMGLVAALTVAAIPWGINLAYGNAGPAGVTFYANSPSGINPANLSNSGNPLRKFFDALPGVSPAHQNLRGQFIPIAVKDTTTYPGCDYYQIGVVQNLRAVPYRPVRTQYGAGLCGPRYGHHPGVPLWRSHHHCQTRHRRCGSCIPTSCPQPQRQTLPAGGPDPHGFRA